MSFASLLAPSIAVSKDVPNLKVVTLNIWGIKFLSNDLEDRISHLIEALQQTEYDIVALQEVWSKKHFLRMKQELESSYKYSHYFYSGLLGSGCCIFSKHFIEDTFHYKYSLNGYPHKLNHGDWFGGKLVGLARVSYHNIKLNVYVTHLHANYDKHQVKNHYSDGYLSHRISQLYELSQFIDKTSGSAQASILLGDLNTHDNEVGFGLLKYNANLKDAFKDGQKTGFSKHSGVTCYSDSNIYAQSSSIRKYYNDGIRIDYILYKSNSDIAMDCLECKCCLGKISNSIKGLNYSDHEGVYAQFSFTENAYGSSNGSSLQPEKFEDAIFTMESAQEIIKKGIESTFHYQLIFFVIAIVSITFLCLFNHSNPAIAALKNIFFTFLLSFAFVYVLIIKTVEKNQLINMHCSLDRSVNTLRCMHQQMSNNMASATHCQIDPNTSGGAGSLSSGNANNRKSNNSSPRETKITISS